MQSSDFNGNPDTRSGLAYSELFQHLTEAEIEEILPICQARFYQQGQTILKEDGKRRELLIVVDGILEVCRYSVDGRKYIFGYAHRGRVLALPRLLARAPKDFHYNAYTDCALIHIPCDQFLKHLDSRPQIWRHIVTLLLEQRIESLEWMHVHAIGTLQQRVAGALLQETLQRRASAETQGRLALSQDELSQMLGVSRQSVNKELRRMALLGAIEIRYRSINITNIGLLQTLEAGGIPDGVRRPSA